ncbi:MAG: PE family protein, partial [Acidimicrobiales bacterium]
MAAATGAARLLGAVCAGAATVSDAGTVSDPALDEASGIAASRRNPGVWWVHDDSGDTARFFGLSDTGQVVATVDVDGATAVDWEDIAVGPPATDAGETLYLGDIGDNGRSRSNVTVYRTTEPAVDRSTPGATAHLRADTLTLTYPDGPHDAEALMVDPRSGDLVIVTKDWTLAGRSQVFRAPADRPAGSTTVLEQVATLDLPIATLVTGADISPDGSLVALRSYAGVALYPREEGQDLWDAFDQQPCAGPLPVEKQGEAIGFAADGSSYATISEGTRPTLHL